MRSVSKKRARVNRIRRKVLAPFILDGTPCPVQLAGCAGRATDGHEVRTRKRGGSITEPENIEVICRHCHEVITKNSGKEGWAIRHGWVVASWAGPEDEEEAWSVRTAWHCQVDCPTDHRRTHGS